MIKRHYHIRVASKPQHYDRHFNNNEPVVMTAIVTVRSFFENPSAARNDGINNLTKLSIVKSDKEEYIVTSFSRC